MIQIIIIIIIIITTIIIVRPRLLLLAEDLGPGEGDRAMLQRLVSLIIQKQ